MSVVLVIAFVVLGIFVGILVALALIGPSEPDTATRKVVEQGLTGPVSLPPAPHTRLGTPNRQEADDETA